MIIGALLSGGVLVLTFWPAVKDDTKRVAIAAIGLIFLCHLLLASGFVVSILSLHIYVLVLTFWPAVKDDTKRVAISAIGLIFLCHLLLASGFVVSKVKPV